MSEAQYFNSGSLHTFLKFSLGYTSFSDQSLFWHLYICTVSYVYLWMAVMEFLITSPQPMGSKASALPTWDGQGQSLSSTRRDSTINPTMESMPCHWPAYMHTSCQRSRFQRSEGNKGPPKHASRTHLPTQCCYTVTKAAPNHSQVTQANKSTGHSKDT